MFGSHRCLIDHRHQATLWPQHALSPRASDTVRGDYGLRPTVALATASPDLSSRASDTVRGDYGLRPTVALATASPEFKSLRHSKR